MGNVRQREVLYHGIAGKGPLLAAAGATLGDSDSGG